MMASARICLQWTVIIFNFLSVILGIAATVAAVYELDKYSEDRTDHMERIIQVVIAVVLVLSAFIGCFGAVNGSIKVLWMFVATLCSLLACHIWRMVRYDEEEQIAAAKVTVKYAWIEESFKAGAMNDLQIEYECCGERSFTDYTNLRMAIPLSCYPNQEKLATSYPFTEGCASALKHAYMEVYRYEKYAHISLMVFELLGIVLTLILICKLMAKSRRYRY